MIRLMLVLLATLSARGGEFFSGQAARAVLGQSSFSSREAGIVASAMTIQKDRLNVADRSGLVSVFDLTKLPAVSDEVHRHGTEACALCGFAPAETVPQAVAAGSSTVSMFGKRLAAIDTRTHRILIWNDVTSPTANYGPDVTLGLSDPGVSTVNESTIIDPISVAIDGSRLFVGDAALHRVLIWKRIPTSPNQPADAVLGQPDFSSREATDTPRANTIARPDALVSDGVNLFVADSHDRRVLVFSAADTLLPSESILNSASLSTALFAPGTLVTISKANLSDHNASAPDAEPTALPTKLGGAEVYLDGVPIPLLSVSPSEIRAQLPYTALASGAGSLYVRAERADGSIRVSAPASVIFGSASPGIFSFAGPEPRNGILLHSGDQAKAGSPVTRQAPALPGEIVALWVTGLHTVPPSPDQAPAAGVPFSGGELGFSPIRALVNGQAAEVVSAALPLTSIGVYQVQVLLPQGLSGDNSELSISEDGYNSNTVTFPSNKP